MSTFEVKAYKVKVEEHPNADRLEIIRPEGTSYVCVSEKGLYKDGDLAVYVPESAVVPEKILRLGWWDEEKGKGFLAGSKGDRVKAVKLRGQVSQGILLRPDLVGLEVQEGEDYGEVLGITKYVPEIPMHMSGQVVQSDIIYRYTDIENYKRYPDEIEDDLPVVMTEKLHGTCVVFAKNYVDFAVSSKGYASRGFSLVEDPGNVYWRMAREYEVEETMAEIYRDQMNDAGGGMDETLYLFGEIIGVQDLKYGLTKGNLDLYMFDMGIFIPWIGPDILYAPYDVMAGSIAQKVVPEVWRGPFSHEALLEATEGDSLIDGADHMREGVVVKPIQEEDPVNNRTILKSVSEAYLLRRGVTTEYE